MGDKPLHCPRCDREIPKLDVDWIQLTARCHHCELTLPLMGYIDDPELPPGEAEKHFQPLELAMPPGLKLKRSAAPGVESFNIGGKLVGIQVRLEQDTLVVKGLFGRERLVPLAVLLGFTALQHVHHLGEPGLNPGDVTWHLVAVLDDATMLRLWELDDRDQARYLASELNRVHQRMQP